MTEDAHSQFAARLQSLVGKPCWGFIAGAGTGSVVSLLLGQKVPRPKPSTNPTLSDELRRFDGELVLFVSCPWRIDAADHVVVGCWEDNRQGGPMLTGLQTLVGCRVVDVSGAAPAWDLTVRFDNGCSLRVFCDQTSLDDPADNYSLFTADLICTVGVRSELSLEPR